jgi:hypothetical protein
MTRMRDATSMAGALQRPGQAAILLGRKRTPAADPQVQSLAAFTTCDGDELRLERGADGCWGIKPQGRVVRADIPCGNGVIHVAALPSSHAVTVRSSKQRESCP